MRQYHEKRKSRQNAHGLGLRGHEANIHALQAGLLLGMTQRLWHQLHFENNYSTEVPWRVFPAGGVGVCGRVGVVRVRTCVCVCDSVCLNVGLFLCVGVITK